MIIAFQKQDKPIFNNLDDDCFMIVDELEIDDGFLNAARQLVFRGKVFQVDREESVVEPRGQMTLNVQIEVNGLYGEDD